MTSRTVILATPQSNRPVRVENFGGTTWGDLKSHESVENLVNGNVEAILREGKVTLSREDAVLPAGDFTVFLVPTKNKAGMIPADAQILGQQISDAIQRAASIASDKEVSKLKEALISEIADFFDVDEEAITEPTTQNTQDLSDHDREVMNEYNSFR